MVSLDEQLYKEKYLKYKKKYIQLKEYQGGSIKGMYENVKKKAKKVKTNVNEKLNMKAYIIAKTDELTKIQDGIKNGLIKNNISDIKNILNLKGYIIYSDDPKKIKLIGAKGILSKVGDSKNDLADLLVFNKTLNGEINKISTYIDNIINVINFINNNKYTTDLLNNIDSSTGDNNQCNNIKCYINKIIETEKINKDYVNSIKQIINNNNKIKLKRNVSTYPYSDEIINNDTSIFDATYDKSNINNIINEVKNELQKLNNNDTKLSHIFIKYKSAVTSDANITFYLNNT
jgi:hypothetical protein